MINLFSHPVVLRIGFLVALVGLGLPSETDASNLPQCTGSYWHNCQGTSTADGNKYVGVYKDGKMNGQGSLKTATGHEFVGEWKDGKMNGQGTLTFVDGSKYVGEWKDNNFEGNGVQYDASGSIIHSGIWANNKFIREGNVKPLSSVKSIFKYSEYKDIIDGKMYCGTIIAPDKIEDDKKQFIDYLFVTKQNDYKFTISVKLEPSQIFLNLLNNLTKLGSEDLKKEILVEYRFDQSNSLSEKWSTSTSQKSIERPKSYDFINSLIEANTLLIRTLDFMGNQHVSKFTFDDDRSAILRTINNCASVEDLKKPGILEKLDLNLEEKFKIQSEQDDALPKNSISNFEDNLLEAMKVAEEAARRKALEEATRKDIAEKIETARKKAAEEAAQIETARKKTADEAAKRLFDAELRTKNLEESLAVLGCKPLDDKKIAKVDPQIEENKEHVVSEVTKYLNEEAASINKEGAEASWETFLRASAQEEHVYFLEVMLAKCKKEAAKQADNLKREGTPKALHQQNCEFVYQRAYPNRLYDRGKSCPQMPTDENLLINDVKKFLNSPSFPEP